jgi:3',5'-cyclic AMP phosphodiesterase CpdA
MNIGILCDLHLGHSAEDRWHNRLLFDRAPEIARLAVPALNRQNLDMIAVLGDITNAGAESELLLAHAILSDLTIPWYVLPGNHDRMAVQSGSFDKVFQENLPNFYRRQGTIGMLFLRESLPDGEVQSPAIELGSAQIDRVIQTVVADRPGTLIIFSHFPLISQAAFANKHGGKDAGHYADGMELLVCLEKLVRNRVVILCGHQHWHHIMEGARWIQCTTGAMIEYPMEFRIAEISDTMLRVSVFAGTAARLAAESLDSAKWVRGQDSDRNCEVALDRRLDCLHS